MSRGFYIFLCWVFMLLSFVGFLFNDFKFLVFCGIVSVTIASFSRAK